MTLRFMPFGGFWSAAPITFLTTAPVELLTHTSLTNGISPPLYKGDGFFVLPSSWTDIEVDSFASLWSEKPISLELSDEEENALIAVINRNVVSTPPT